MTQLEGKIAAIAGASGGMGREVARVFAERGCDLAMSYHSNEAPAKAVLQEALKMGRRARLDQAETSDPAAARRWIGQALGEFGHIDILVSCVGAHLPQGFSLFAKQDPATWRGIIDAQLMAFIYACRPAVEHMLERGSGRIIALGSEGGKVGESGVAVANAGNAGLIGFARSLAREVGRNGITVNVVCPGPTEGPTLQKILGQGDTGTRLVEEMIRRVPMKRLGTAHDVATTMAFLASDDASFITGQAISVSGGLVMG